MVHLGNDAKTWEGRKDTLFWMKELRGLRIKNSWELEGWKTWGKDDSSECTGQQMIMDF